MLKEICDLEKLPVGWILHEGHHVDCPQGHAYALLTKTLAVGNTPENDGPSDAFLATPVPVLGADGTHIGWSAGEPVKPLEAPYNCPVCSQPLGIR